MPTKPNYTYNIGDRVAERPKTHSNFAMRPESFAIVKRCAKQRYGTVIQIKEKKASDKRTNKYLIIKWDHLTSPSEHAQCRICPIDQISFLTNQISSTLEA